MQVNLDLRMRQVELEATEVKKKGVREYARTIWSTKSTTDIYLHEQSILYSKSVAELALLEIAEKGCQNTFNMSFDGIYDANVTMRYVYTEANTNVAGTACNEYINPYIQTDEQNGSVLMDITVSTNVGTEPIRYFRRTIQKH